MQDFSRLVLPALSALSVCSLSLLSACGPHKPNSGPDRIPPQLNIKQSTQDQLANNETRLLITATDNRSVAKIIVYRKGPSDKDFVNIGTGIKTTTTNTYEYLDRVDVAGRYEYRVKAIDPSGNTAQQTISTVIQFSRGLSRIQATVAEYTLNRQAEHAKIQPRAWSGGTGELQLRQLNTTTTLATTTLKTNGTFALPLPKVPTTQPNNALRPATSLLAEVLGEQPTHCTGTPNFKSQAAKIMLGRLYARGTTDTTSALLATNSGSYSVRGITNGSVRASGSQKINTDDDKNDVNVSKSSNMTEGVLIYSDGYVGISDSSKKQLCNAPSKYTGKMEIHYSVEIGKGWHFFNVSFTDRGATADPRYTLVLNNADWPETDTVFYGWGDFIKKTD